MSTSYSPRMVTEGLVWYVDFANPRSYISGSLTGSNLVDGVTGVMSPAAVPPFFTASLGSLVFSRASNPSLSIGSYNNPQAITIACWFYATASSAGGKLIGFDNGGQYDRHLYMTASGSIAFGIYPGSSVAISSSLEYRDSTWHYVVGTFTSSSTSMSLYIDGVSVAALGGVANAQSYTAPWKVGGGSLSGWPNATVGTSFQGNIASAIAYHRVLSDIEIQQNFNATRGRFRV